MDQARTLNAVFFRLPDFLQPKEKKAGRPPTCPQCRCVLDRPHAFRCSRCLAEIPQARGCSGCGKCRKS